MTINHDHALTQSSPILTHPPSARRLLLRHAQSDCFVVLHSAGTCAADALPIGQVYDAQARGLPSYDAAAPNGACSAQPSSLEMLLCAESAVSGMSAAGCMRSSPVRATHSGSAHLPLLIHPPWHGA